MTPRIRPWISSASDVQCLEETTKLGGVAHSYKIK
jgi:hypothetical protein